MSKKIKPVNCQFNAVNSGDANDNSVSVQLDQIPGNIISDTVKEKVEIIDGIEKENARLATENSILQEKIASYIQEVNDLKARLSCCSEQVTENLTKQIERLRADNDALSAKASDLVRENERLLSPGQAKPSCPPSNLGKANILPVQSQQYCRNPYRDGYKDWN